MSDTAHHYSRIRDYVAINQAAVKEMHRQVGDLVLDSDGIAKRGLLARHLVLPGLPEETEMVLEYIAGELSPNTYLNLMDQYHPCYRADNYPPLDRPLEVNEYREAIGKAHALGLSRLDQRRNPRLWF